MDNARDGKRTPAEEPKELLDQRAAELSQVRGEPQQETLRVVQLRIGREHAAVPAECVQEVASPVPKPTRVPGTPSFLLGVVNLRGKILACLDLGEFLGVASAFSDSVPYMLVVRHDDFEVGIAADDVSDVMAVPVANIDPPTSVLNSERARFIRGVFYVDGRALALVDLQSLTRSERMRSLRGGTT